MALLILLGAVLFGIYGPKIANRLTLLAGMPLGDVVAFVMDTRIQAIYLCQQQQDEPPLNTADKDEIISSILGRSFHLPDLTKAGYRLRKVSRASIPGAPFHSAELVYQSIPAEIGHWLVLYLAADDDQYLSFDALGRARQFTPSLLLLEDIPMNSADQSLVMIWSDGSVLYLACVENEIEANKIQAIFAVLQD